MNGVVDKCLLRLSDCMHTSAGFFGGVGCILVNYFTGYVGSVLMVILCVVLDAFWGIAVAISRGGFALSELARQTITKLSCYGTVIIIFIGIEGILDMGSVMPVAIVSGLICLCELWSSIGNILIINPNIVFLRFFKKFLTGEISRKLNIPIEEVEDELNKGKSESRCKKAIRKKIKRTN